MRLHFEKLPEATDFFRFALLHLFDHLLHGLDSDCDRSVDVFSFMFSFVFSFMFSFVFSVSSLCHLTDPVRFYGVAQQKRAAIFLNCGLIGDCRNKEKRCEQEGLPSSLFNP